MRSRCSSAFPDERQRLIDDPSLMKSAVEEVLRFESSNQLGNRIVTEDTTLGGVAMPKGTLVTIGIGAANRDPEQFPDPDRFDVARNPTRHLAFGSGIHMCAGMNLARLEGRIAIERFLARFPRLRAGRRADAQPPRALPRFLALPVRLELNKCATNNKNGRNPMNEMISPTIGLSTSLVANYMSGFGNTFETEALPGALPVGRNSPQKVNYGLYAEQLSGSPFTAPQALESALVALSHPPGVRHTGRFENIDSGLIRTAPEREGELPIGQLRWGPTPIPGESSPSSPACAP